MQLIAQVRGGICTSQEVGGNKRKGYSPSPSRLQFARQFESPHDNHYQHQLCCRLRATSNPERSHGRVSSRSILADALSSIIVLLHSRPTFGPGLETKRKKKHNPNDNDKKYRTGRRSEKSCAGPSRNSRASWPESSTTSAPCPTRTKTCSSAVASSSRSPRPRTCCGMPAPPRTGRL